MSDATSEIVAKSNYWLRVGIALNVHVKTALLDVLHDPAIIGGLPTNEQQVYQQLKTFRQNEEKKLKGILKPVQWDKICHFCDNTCQNPCLKAGKTDTKLLDITAIVVLITNLLPTFSPVLGKRKWKQAFLPVGSKPFNVLLARDFRNKLNHGSIDDLTQEDEFDEEWDEIESILIGLGYKDVQIFQDLKTASLDPLVHEQIAVLARRYEEISDFTESKLKETKNQIDQLNEIVKELKEKIDDTIEESELNGLLDVQRKVERMIHIEILNVNQNINVSSNTYVYGNIEINEQMQRSLIESSKIKINHKENSGQTETENLLKMSEEMKKSTLQRYIPQSTDGSFKEILLNLTRKVSPDDSEASNVQMIHHQATEQRKVGANNSILADYDEIISSPNENTIIIGCPGSGKTSLVDTLLKKWASNKLWSSTENVKFQFVFVIYFRQLNRFKDRAGITAMEILKHFYPDVSFEEFRKKNRLKEINCLLILEGFDEFAEVEEFEKEGRISFLAQAVNDLISPVYPKLPFSRIVTSRSEGLKHLRKLFKDKNEKLIVNELQLTGFDYDGLNIYISRSLDLDCPLQRNIIEHTKANEKLFDMMTIPFYCRGICDLIKHNELRIDEILLTYTALFSKLFTLHLWKNGGFGTTELSEMFKNAKFKKLCIDLARFANDHKIIFNVDEIESISNDFDMKLLVESGLIIQLKDEDALSSSYQFLHYSYQEFLIALHNYNFKDRSRNFSPKTKHIATMVVGLIGASLEDSKSNKSLQQFVKMFEKKANFSSQILFPSDVYSNDDSDSDDYLPDDSTDSDSDTQYNEYGEKIEYEYEEEDEPKARHNADCLLEYGLANELPKLQGRIFVKFDNELSLEDRARLHKNKQVKRFKKY